jgi:hypothetical protein
MSVAMRSMLAVVYPALFATLDAAPPPPPIKSDVLGCSGDRKCGQIFDDYHTGYHGAVAGICFGKRSKKDTGATSLSYFEVSYAGNPVHHGGTKHKDDLDCYLLTQGEHIVRVEGEVQERRGASKLKSLRFTSNYNRTSNWFGRAHKYGVSDPVVTTVAPAADLHVMAVHGLGTARNTTNAIRGFGVYWGAGGGAASSGFWALVKSCPGCGTWDFEYDYGTVHSKSKETQVTNTWSMSVSEELKYSFDGFSTSTTVSSSWSRAVMTDIKDSFEVTTMSKRTFSCSMTNLFQWQMTTNFDTPDSPSTTHSAAMICTNVAKPCCLPLTFSSDPTKCDLDPAAPNSCPNQTLLI